MNRAQQRLALRLQAFLVVPALVGTAALVIASTARVRAVLSHGRAATDDALVAELVREQTALAVFEGFALAVALALAASWVARQLGRELGAVIEAGEKIGARELGTRVPVQSKLGLERFPEAFNAMAEKLEGAEAAVRAADERAQEFSQRLAHAQSLAAVGQVAASIAHEVGSPLNAILLSARMAAEDPDCPDEQRATLTRIADQSERIGAILRRMLQLSQPPEEQPGSCDVGAVARDVHAFVRGELRRARVECALELPSEPVRAAIRADKLQQVLFNLVVNAIQAQPSGGRAVIAVRADGDHARIEVRDSGPGVRDEARARLWEPFYTERRASGGTGLGLPVVKGLVERSGGTVEVARAPEGGACFIVLLPAAQPAS